MDATVTGGPVLEGLDVFVLVMEGLDVVGVPLSIPEVVRIDATDGDGEKVLFGLKLLFGLGSASGSETGALAIEEPVVRTLTVGVAGKKPGKLPAGVCITIRDAGEPDRDVRSCARGTCTLPTVTAR